MRLNPASLSVEELLSINQKKKILRDVYINQRITPEKAAKTITERRIAWFEENKQELFNKYFFNPEKEKIRLEEVAFKIIYREHMKIKEEKGENKIKLVDIGKSGLKIICRNLCPYQEAWYELVEEKETNIDIKKVCKEINEPGVNKLLELICEELFVPAIEKLGLPIENPYLKFIRDYDYIRPYKDHCLEFIKPKTE
jgi:hypothetical protein